MDMSMFQLVTLYLQKQVVSWLWPMSCNLLTSALDCLHSSVFSNWSTKWKSLFLYCIYEEETYSYFDSIEDTVVFLDPFTQASKWFLKEKCVLECLENMYLKISIKCMKVSQFWGQTCLSNAPKVSLLHKIPKLSLPSIPGCRPVL